MDDRAPSAYFGRHDKISAQQGYRHFGKIKIELNSRADEEGASQKFANVPAARWEIKRRQTEDDQCDEKCGDHFPTGFIALPSFGPMMALSLASG